MLGGSLECTERGLMKEVMTTCNLHITAWCSRLSKRILKEVWASVYVKTGKL